MTCAILYILVLFSVSSVYSWSDTRVRRFKDDFLFGVATSSYQSEGAWNEDGKGENIWDRYFHEHPEAIADGRNGDVASDSYHNYQRDVQMLRELGVDHYRFSISWPRILPDGFANKTNEKGFEYYDKLINELIQYGIKPMITLYHFDLPQKLQDLGGWTNPLSVDWFRNYAKIVFHRYADRVPYWVTINQPSSICFKGVSGVEFAQGKNKGDEYICLRNVMLAHAKAYRLYEKEYKRKYKGSIGISLSLNWADPKNNKTENKEATDLYRQLTLDLYLHPIWSKSGNFPIEVKRHVKQISIEMGYEKSLLPELSQEEVRLLKGSSDFVGINHYTTMIVSKTGKKELGGHLDKELGVELSYEKEWIHSQSPWLKGAPYGLYKVCLYISRRYDYPSVFITEHGWSTGQILWDQSRADTLRYYLSALLYAIEDGTDVIGYTMWSLLDSIEWFAGTSERFGLYEVDFESKEKTRTARLSALVYKRIIQKRIVKEEWTPETLNMSITKKKNVRSDL